MATEVYNWVQKFDADMDSKQVTMGAFFWDYSVYSYFRIGINGIVPKERTLMKS